MSVPAVLLRKSTGEIIKHDTYPSITVEPLLGLDSDLEWLIKYIPYSKPAYDPRIYQLVTSEEVTSIEHPDYPGLNQYLITYSTQKRPPAEIETAVKNAEQIANNQILPNQRQLKLIILSLGILFRKVEGLQLDQKEQVIADKAVNAAVSMWQNDQNLRTKIQEIANGQEPNIDDGWINVDPEI